MVTFGILMMKSRPLALNHFARLSLCLPWLAVSALSVSAHAVGLGNIQLESGLGQPVHARIAVYDADPALDSRCINVHIDSADHQLLMNAQAQVNRDKDGNATIQLATHKSLYEPAAYIKVSVSCSDNYYQREYAVLLDMPGQSDESPPAQAATPTGTSVAIDMPATSVMPRAPRAAHHSPSLATLHPRAHPRNRHVAAVHASAQPRLTLSDDTGSSIPPQGINLRMSSEIISQLEVQSASNLAELRAARAHLSQMMTQHQDNPAATADAQLRLKQQDIISLQHQIDSLHEQLQHRAASLPATLPVNSGQNWFVILIGLVAAEGLALVLLARRMLGIREQQHQALLEDGAAVTPSVPPMAKPASVRPNALPLAEVASEPVMHPNEYPLPAFETVEPEPVSRPVQSQDSGRSPVQAHSAMQANASANMEVEEISDVSQEAEFWMSVNNPQKAIEVLEAQTIDSASPLQESPAPWLYLLDLYRVTGARDKYEQLRDRVSSLFNARTIDYDEDPAILDLRQIEDYPHLIRNITECWKTPSEAIDYLKSLLLANPEHKRVGFDLPVYRDIMMLIGLAQELERGEFSFADARHLFNVRTADDLDLDIADFHEACRIVK